MSDTDTKPAEPTENQPGGTSADANDEAEAVDAEPAENQPGGRRAKAQ
jgi:hypothetical protein